MKKKDLILALIVAMVWGGNFTVIKIGLEDITPMFLAVLRYTFTALPAIAFIKRPAVEWRYVIAYGLTIGFGQFSCLFYAMTIGMPAGIASMVLQSQAFFTIVFASVLLKEPIKARQILGFIVAALGLYLIGGINHSGAVSSIPALPLFLTISAAAFWGISNVIVRLAAHRTASRGETLDMLSMVTWSSLVPPLPLLAVALMMDTPQTLINSLKSINSLSVFSVGYLAYCGTIFGSATWSRLLAKYSAGKVAPFSLLVPVTGLITAQLILGEKLSTWQWLGSMTILFGLAICNGWYFSISKILHVWKTKAAITPAKSKHAASQKK